MLGSRTLLRILRMEGRARQQPIECEIAAGLFGDCPRRRSSCIAAFPQVDADESSGDVGPHEKTLRVRGPSNKPHAPPALSSRDS